MKDKKKSCRNWDKKAKLENTKFKELIKDHQIKILLVSFAPHLITQIIFRDASSVTKSFGILEDKGHR